MWYIHKTENYLTIKKNEIVIYATIWMDLKNINLSERYLLQRATYFMVQFTENVKNRQIHKYRKYVSVHQDLREEEMNK